MQSAIQQQAFKRDPDLGSSEVEIMTRAIFMDEVERPSASKNGDESSVRILKRKAEIQRCLLVVWTQNAAFTLANMGHITNTTAYCVKVRIRKINQSEVLYKESRWGGRNVILILPQQQLAHGSRVLNPTHSKAVTVPPLKSSQRVKNSNSLLTKSVMTRRTRNDDA